jgi:hypothetical protein
MSQQKIYRDLIKDARFVYKYLQVEKNWTFFSFKLNPRAKSFKNWSPIWSVLNHFVRIGPANPDLWVQKSRFVRIHGHDCSQIEGFSGRIHFLRISYTNLASLYLIPLWKREGKSISEAINTVSFFAAAFKSLSLCVSHILR